MSHRLISSFILLIINVITSSNASEIVREAYPYATVGTGPVILIPNIGIGYRQRVSRLGLDTAIGYSTIGYVHQVEGRFDALFFLNRCNKNSHYLGCGVAGSTIFCNNGDCAALLLSPDFVFGKAFNKQFIEAHIEIPNFFFGCNKPFYFPLMYVKYGISF